METWLKDKLEDGNIPGLKWTDSREKQFRLPAKHLRRRDFSENDDAVYKVQPMSRTVSHSTRCITGTMSFHRH